MKTFFFTAFHTYLQVPCRCLHIMYIFIDAKVNHTSLKNAGSENSGW